MTYRGPIEFAEAIRERLTSNGVQSPSNEFLRRLCTLAFRASMETEEDRPVVCSLIYMDPGLPDPDPPPRPTATYWSSVPFTSSVTPLSLQALVKLALASDSRTSHVAVYEDDDGQPYAWGLVDQGNPRHEYVTLESNTGPAWPDLLQLTIQGVGYIAADVRYERVATLRSGQLTVGGVDPLREGPVRSTLGLGADRMVDAVRSQVGEPMDLRDHWVASLSDEWFRTLKRLVLRIKGLGHGGAVILSPAPRAPVIDVKYGINYRRLRDSLVEGSVSRIVAVNASDKIFEDHLERRDDHIATATYLDESVASNDKSERENEASNAIWFVASLSRVDGLVLMDTDLVVHGFGAMVTAEDPPNAVSVAFDAHARKLAPLDYESLGSRHRSVMRYCSAVDNSVGIVLSQDGSTSIMTLNDGHLVVWTEVDLLRG